MVRTADSSWAARGRPGLDRSVAGVRGDDRGHGDDQGGSLGDASERPDGMVHREAELLLQALPGEGATIFRLVIRLAHELRLAAMAEGVEGHEQRDQLE